MQRSKHGLGSPKMHLELRLGWERWALCKDHQVIRAPVLGSLLPTQADPARVLQWKNYVEVRQENARKL